jgi:plasmid stability protein
MSEYRSIEQQARETLIAALVAGFESIPESDPRKAPAREAYAVAQALLSGEILWAEVRFTLEEGLLSMTGPYTREQATAQAKIRQENPYTQSEYHVETLGRRFL